MQEVTVKKKQMNTEEILNYMYSNKRTLLNKSKVSSYEHAEDVFQSVAMRIFKMNRDSEIKYVDTYLVQALMYEFLNHRRNNNSQILRGTNGRKVDVLSLNDVIYDSADSVTPEHQLQRKQNLRILNKMFEGLTDIQKKCVYLRYMEDVDQREGSKIFNCSAETFKANCRYGLLKLRAKVKDIKKMEIV